MKVAILCYTSKTANKRALVERGEPAPRMLRQVVDFRDLPAHLRRDIVEFLEFSGKPLPENSGASIDIWLGEYVVDQDSGVISLKYAEADDENVDLTAELAKTLESYSRAKRVSNDVLRLRTRQWIEEARESASRLLAGGEMTPKLEGMYCGREPWIPGTIQKFLDAGCDQALKSEALQALDDLICAWKTRRERDAAERERRKVEQRENDLAWIERFGSNLLRLTVEKGYDYVERYIEERLSFELPGFERWNGGDSWREASSPSMTALLAAEECNGKVVQLYDGREAVIVERPWMHGGKAYKVIA